MITLITGSPGRGKTSLMVSMLMGEYKDRPVFVFGINDLTLPHFVTPPVAQWTVMKPKKEDPTISTPHFNFAPDSVLVVDECQNLYRPRGSASKVPDIVAALETHRHEGMDIVLITQGTHLIDGNVTALVDRHMHIRDNLLGRWIYEWKEAVSTKSLSRSVMGEAIKRKFSPPKKAFDKYKSAELHTKTKFRFNYIWLIVSVLLIGIGYKFYQVNEIFEKNMNPDLPNELTPEDNLINKDLEFKPTVANTSTQNPVQLTYLEANKPEIEGLDYTAPIYQANMKINQIPYPAACFTSAKKGCKCYTQQATLINMQPDLCNQIVKNGIFLPFLENKVVRVSTPRTYQSKEPEKPHYSDSDDYPNNWDNVNDDSLTSSPAY